MAPRLSFRATALLFLLALSLRAALLLAGPWADPGRAWMGDSGRYLQLGENLRTYRTFGLATEEGLPWSGLAALRAANGTMPAADANGLRPESMRTPGYPVFIAAVRSFADDPRAVLLVQCVLGSLLACLTAGIASALGFMPRGAFLTGLLWALHPGLIAFDLVFLTEALFNVCAVAGLYFAARARSPWGLAAAGLLIGAAGLVRPLGLLFLPAALALVWPHCKARAVAWVAVLAILPSTLWAARNYSAGEGYRVSWIGDATALFHFAGYPISEERGEDWLAAWPRRNEELLARLGPRIRPGDDVFDQARRLALEEMQARPVAVARVLVKSQVKLYLDHSAGIIADLLGVPYRPSGLFSQLALGQPGAMRVDNPGALLLALGWSLLNVGMALAAFAGLLRAVRHRRYQLVFVCGLTVLLFTAATMTQGLERFRMPLMLPLILLAGSWWGLPAPETRKAEITEEPTPRRAIGQRCEPDPEYVSPAVVGG